MPVTARLSKAFYDQLGEQVANELVDWSNQVDLTYRTELRELNDLNFARFDAKVGERLAELRSDLEQWFRPSSGPRVRESGPTSALSCYGLQDRLVAPPGHAPGSAHRVAMD